MPRIVLATLNAKYIHASFGLRYLFANLGDLQSQAEIFESDINQRPLDIAEAILQRLDEAESASLPARAPSLDNEGRFDNKESFDNSGMASVLPNLPNAPTLPNSSPSPRGEGRGEEPSPQILGLGVYIWNATETRELVQILKRVRPSLTIILGGPEVSYETENQPIVHASNYVITGEADLKFADLCRAILCGEPPRQKIHNADLPDLGKLVLPYPFYNDRDVANRVIYVEASRGCPFTCEFCLSSLDIPVRQFLIEPFLAAMQRLLDRGVQHFKFVDRTFNLNLQTSRAILEFFLARLRPGLFLHFEMIPDRLPVELREIIARFPPATLQFEVGIQTFNDEVSNRIKRRQNLKRLADNFQYLRGQTGVHIHADLIAGLPGETLESFAAGFDRLIALGPQEIQVGILKRLRGTPIVRHDHEFAMRYNVDPPYEILQNNVLDFATLQKLRRFARFWDLIGNSGNFVQTTPLIWSNDNSPFWSFWNLSDFLYAELRRTHEIALPQLMQLLMQWLEKNPLLSRDAVAKAMLTDWARSGRRDLPEFLREFGELPREGQATNAMTLKRQRRRAANRESSPQESVRS